MWPLSWDWQSGGNIPVVCLVCQEHGHFTKPYQREFLGSQFCRWNLEPWLGYVDAWEHCLLHDTDRLWPCVVPVVGFIIVIVLGNVVLPHNGWSVCPLSWVHLFNSLRWSNSNLGHCPNHWHSFATPPYAANSLRDSNRHPWKWACQSWWSVDYPWKWYSLVGSGGVQRLFCCSFAFAVADFAMAIFVSILPNFSSASFCLAIVWDRSF